MRKEDNYYIKNDLLPPYEAECIEDRDFQADWLEAQARRLPLNQKEHNKFVSTLTDAWDRMQITPREIRDFIDKEVGSIE